MTFFGCQLPVIGKDCVDELHDVEDVVDERDHLLFTILEIKFSTLTTNTISRKSGLITIISLGAWDSLRHLFVH